jgi:glutathionylspermidine synthase
MDLRAAIDDYHALLTDELAGETDALLADLQRRRGLAFGDRPLCTVLRPRFLLPEHQRYLAESMRVLLGAFARAHAAALEDAAFRAQFALTDWEEALVRGSPGFRAPSPTSRLDTFYFPESGALALTEYNAETPAAPAYCDALSEVFFALPAMREFTRRYEVRPLPARHNVLHALLDAHRQWSSSAEAPRIAILDWREVPTYSEHVLFRDYFRSLGLECITADPREVAYRDGKLVAGDFTITLIYKRVLLSELVERGGRDHPVIRAVREGAVCMVNPFACKILHKKASLAVLSDERNAALFTAEQQAAIARHVPWTRRVEERRTTFAGQAVDLVPFIAEHREHLVLKANDEYGGKGIVLGWLTPPEEWERAIQTALAEPFVVQDRVPIPEEAYPALDGGRVALASRIMDTAPFIFYGEYMDGCLTRLSTNALVNVTAGGGSTVPTFVVSPR